MDGSLAEFSEWLAQAAESLGGAQAPTPEAVAELLLDGLMPDAASALRHELADLWQADDPDPEGELVTEALQQPCPEPTTQWRPLGVGTVNAGGLPLGLLVYRDGDLDERASAGAQALVLALVLADAHGKVEAAAETDDEGDAGKGAR